MKLSMWMIANRLSDFSMDLSIRESAPVSLRSARRAYSTECVRVYQDGGSVICSGEGDYIRIHNISLAEGLEIIQGIFDFYEDWSESLELEIRDRNYEKIADRCWQVFHDPIIIMDANNHALGLTRQYPPDSLDFEWSYLSRYGYTSVNAVRQLEENTPAGVFWRHGVQRFGTARGNTLGYGGASYSMFRGDEYCGRLTVLEAERPLNRGDIQLLRYVGTRLETALREESLPEENQNGNVLFKLLLEQPYDAAALDFQLRYYQWNREDTFSLVILELPEQDDAQNGSRDIDMLRSILISHLSGVAVLQHGVGLLLLSNRYLPDDGASCTLLRSLSIGNPLKVSFSLTCRGIENTPALYRQASYAMEAGKRERPGESFYDCFYYGIEYILRSRSLEDACSACMPAVCRIWENRDSGGEQFQTLKAFLDNERSVSKTAEALFTHRNTIIYRLKKIEEALGCSLDELYIREYCRISIRVLELAWKDQCMNHPHNP